MRRYHPRMSPRTPAHPKHELAQAVFHSVYSSREQRRRRWLATLLLVTKHTLRGLLFSWPLYLMVVAGFYTDRPVNVLLWALGVPGIALSVAILARGIREEYRTRIADRLLKQGDLLRVLRGGAA
jgi:hypothetical protein